MTQQHIPEVPHDMPAHHRNFFQAMRKVLMAVQGGSNPPAPPVQVKVTGVGAAIVVQFTKGNGADGTILYMGDSPDITMAQTVPLGVSTRFSDEVGTNAKRYYWLQSTRNGNPLGQIAGPYTGTALTAGTAGTVPAAPPITGQPGNRGIQPGYNGRPNTE